MSVDSVVFAVRWREGVCESVVGGALFFVGGIDGARRGVQAVDGARRLSVVRVDSGTIRIGCDAHTHPHPEADGVSGGDGAVGGTDCFLRA